MTTAPNVRIVNSYPRSAFLTDQRHVSHCLTADHVKLFRDQEASRFSMRHMTADRSSLSKYTMICLQDHCFRSFKSVFALFHHYLSHHHAQLKPLEDGKDHKACHLHQKPQIDDIISTCPDCRNPVPLIIEAFDSQCSHCWSNIRRQYLGGHGHKYVDAPCSPQTFLAIFFRTGCMYKPDVHLLCCSESCSFPLTTHSLSTMLNHLYVHHHTEISDILLADVDVRLEFESATHPVPPCPLFAVNLAWYSDKVTL